MKGRFLHDVNGIRFVMVGFIVTLTSFFAMKLVIIFARRGFYVSITCSDEIRFINIVHIRMTSSVFAATTGK